jgi:hypothetical protein
MRTFCRPAHRLMFAHSFVHEVIHSRFRGRARYPEPMTVGMSVICQAASVAHQIVAQLQEMISKALQSFRVCRAIVVGDGIDNAATPTKISRIRVISSAHRPFHIWWRTRGSFSRKFVASAGSTVSTAAAVLAVICSMALSRILMWSQSRISRADLLVAACTRFVNPSAPSATTAKCDRDVHPFASSAERMKRCASSALRATQANEPPNWPSALTRPATT